MSSAPEVGDIVRVAQDHVPAERGTWWRVFGHYTSKHYGACVELMRVEHFPSSDWPKGMCAFHRVVPVVWVKVDAVKTRMWKEHVT